MASPGGARLEHVLRASVDYPGGYTLSFSEISGPSRRGSTSTPTAAEASRYPHTLHITHTPLVCTACFALIQSFVVTAASGCSPCFCVCLNELQQDEATCMVLVALCTQTVLHTVTGPAKCTHTCSLTHHATSGAAV